MIDFKTSKTKENLLKAFAGESQARNRYTFAAEVAKTEGYPICYLKEPTQKCIIYIRMERSTRPAERASYSLALLSKSSGNLSRVATVENVRRSS